MEVAHGDDGATQYVDENLNTLDIGHDATGLSLAIWLHADRAGDFAVPAHQIPQLIAALLTGPDPESMGELSARYDAMFTPPDASLSGPPYELLWLTSALLSSLARRRDYETWDAHRSDDVDGLLREIIQLATNLRTRLVTGTPDAPYACSGSAGCRAPEGEQYHAHYCPERLTRR